jgi:hypothetical protein
MPNDRRMGDKLGGNPLIIDGGPEFRVLRKQEEGWGRSGQGADNGQWLEGWGKGEQRKLLDWDRARGSSGRF